MADIKVTSTELRATAQHLSAGSSDIESQLTTLHNQVQALVDNGWQGSASAAFNHMYQQWHTSASQLKQSLDAISKQLTQAAHAYEITEGGLTHSMSA